ncbi:MAG TPA: GNAT family N-acetyltransferase [Bacteroidales bacterium]|nr:GNAT family N-acetyltransferase [Bacteroidales bacterium]
MTEFTLKYSYNEMDFEKVTLMLKDVWWSPGIGKAEVMQGAQNSALIVGAFDANNEQIGYSRVISDKTRFAYIMDVVVDTRYRKKGIGQAMISFILKHPELKDVYQWVLLTKDAHGVYSKVGFKPIAQPENWMEIRHNRPDR